MSKSKVALLAAYGMLAATAQQEQKDFLEFTNPYAELPELRYSGSESKSYKKSQYLPSSGWSSGHQALGRAAETCSWGA